MTPTSASEPVPVLPTRGELWPRADGPDCLAEIERTPLAARPLPTTTYELVERAADLWPDRPAMTCLRDGGLSQGSSTRSFGDFARDVRRVAAALQALGVQRGSAVALLSVNCEEMLTALLAAEAVGIAAPMNPALSVEHASALLRLSQARILIAAGPELEPGTWARARELAHAAGARALLALRPTEASARPELEPLAGTTVAYLEDLATVRGDAVLAGTPPAATDIASYLHTGGTTGAPKLAARTHANEAINAWMIAATDTLDEDCVLFAALPLFHTNALLVTLLAPLLKGQHVVWAGPLGYRDPALLESFWKLVERYGLSAMSGVPSVYARLLQTPVDSDISTLRMPVVGAAPLPASLVEGFRTATGLELCEGYGLTESTCATSRNWPSAPRRGTVGQRLPYVEVRAARIDEQTGEWQLLPDGELGTIVIRGPTVFAGYLVRGSDKPGIDAGEKVRDGWLNTGDLGRVGSDGYIALTGRVKDLIIRGGHNIDPAVIEDLLLRHPQVSGAAAVGRPDAYAGEVPVAFVTLTTDAVVDEAELLGWVAGRVGEPAATPKAITVVDDIPVTAVGKPFKPELRRRAVESAARHAITDDAAVVNAEILDSQIVVQISGITREQAANALAPFTFEWTLRER